MQGDEVRRHRGLGAVLRRWHRSVGSREVTVAEIMQRLPGLWTGTPVALGGRLARVRGHNVNGYVVTRGGLAGNNGRRWRVERMRVEQVTR
jgi:hypothetical protein